MELDDFRWKNGYLSVLQVECACLFGALECLFHRLARHGLSWTRLSLRLLLRRIRVLLHLLVVVGWPFWCSNDHFITATEVSTTAVILLEEG